MRKVIIIHTKYITCILFLVHGFTNFSRRTTTGTPTTVYGYGAVIQNRNIKKDTIWKVKHRPLVSANK
jgi:hypothetical protein